MLLKCSNSERRVLISSKGAGNLVRGTGMRMSTSAAATMTTRNHRKVIRIPSKRHPGKVLPGKLHAISRMGPGKIGIGKRINPRPHPPPCDNSNDSGFGFDQHVEIQSSPQIIRTIPTQRSIQIDESSSDETDSIGSDSSSLSIMKRRKIENILIDADDACSNDAFVQKIATSTLCETTNISAANIIDSAVTTCIPTAAIASTKYLNGTGRINNRQSLRKPVAQLQNNISTTSKNGQVQLEIVSQPEQQHRARYQTEGSRGAVKDRSGNGFPVVKLIGYNKPAILQVFIGTDIGRVTPHMFYQACKVAGKNSTPCNEKKVDGTMVIEIDFKSESDMIITCDCVGILKERNVDVEHRFPDHSAQRSKKKSTRCRMVFRTQLTHDDGSVETLQVCSHPIVCTQPPGVPEISKKSLKSCPADGGLELFIIGKNFLKDTCIIFQSNPDGSPNHDDLNQINSMQWEATVLPDKEYLQQTHLVCVVPAYQNPNITNAVNVQFFVTSGGKRSESHNFLYTPKGFHTDLSAATTLSTLHGTLQNSQDAARFATDDPGGSGNRIVVWSSGDVMVDMKNGLDAGMMPPPASLPLSVRRPSSSSNLISEQIAQMGLKTELMDENSQGSVADAMQTDTSLEQYSVQTDPSITGSTIKDIQYQQIQKPNMEIIDMGTIQTFTGHESRNHIDVVKQEANMFNLNSLVVKEEQLQNDMLSAAIQNQENVNKLLSSLDRSIDMEKLETGVENTSSVNTIFVSGPNGAGNVIFSQHNINEINNMTANTTNSIEQTLTCNMLSNAASANALNQILNMSPPPSQTGSPKSVSSSPSSVSSSSNSIHSSMTTQDIILNSQPAASINSANIQMMANNSPTDHLSSELIMNTNISPRMICRSTSDPNNMMTTDVTMGNSMLSNISMAPQQSAQDNMLGNMLMNPPNEQIHVAHRTSPVAVKNLILNAAADFITHPENSINNDQSSISALISLNNSPVMTETQSQIQTQILNQAASNSNVLTASEQQQAMEICQAQSSMQQHMSMFNHNPIQNHQIIENQNMPSNNNNTMSNVPLGNMLMNHDVQSSTQNEFLREIRKVDHLNSNMNSNSNQERLLHAISLVPNEMEKTKINNVVEQMSVSQTDNNLTDSSQQRSGQTTFPQEITNMSEHELISFINPTCFDQV